MTQASESVVQVYREWFPASVLLPDQTQWHRVRVYATTEGLLIFRARKAEPDFSSPLDFAKTPRPSTATTYNVGVDLYTEAGLVVITPTGGGACCGTQGGAGLKHWRPEWAKNTVAWPR
jgi:hypothetical protein